MKTGLNINGSDVKVITKDNFDFRFYFKETLTIKLLMLH